MGHRLSRITTRTGDDGTTGLADGSRIDKDSLRIQAIGDVDELNSAIGVLRGHGLIEPIDQVLSEIQHDLFNLGGELSLPGCMLVKTDHIERLEAWAEQFNAELPPLKEFVLPAGPMMVGACHLARAICRRAERSLVALEKAHGKVHAHEPCAMRYLNRLSDLLFIIARTLARSDGGAEVCWRGSTRS